jgi:hypothetical protein
MNYAEYQAFTYLKDKVWTTVHGNNEQNWTNPNSKLIAQKVTEVTGGKIDAKSIQRFAALTPTSGIDKNRTKDILSMFINHRKTDTNQSLDTSIFQKSVQSFQKAEPKNPMAVYAGEYILYYKHVLTNKLSDSISIQIQDNGEALFQGHASKLEGQVIWRQLNPNLFIIFKNDNDYIFLIVKIRTVSSKSDLLYLAGCFSAVGLTNPYPYTQWVLLVKKTEQPADLKRIHAFFDVIGDKHKLIFEQDWFKVLNTRIRLEDTLPLWVKKLHNLCGNWYIYNHSYSYPNAINRDVLIIKSLSEITYRSISNVSTGKMKLKGGTKVIIELENDDIQAQIIINIQHRQVLNFHQEKCLFTSTGVNKPITGIAILEKVDIDAETMTEKAIHPSDAAYQVLQQKGILAELKAVPDIYL